MFLFRNICIAQKHISRLYIVRIQIKYFIHISTQFEKGYLHRFIFKEQGSSLCKYFSYKIRNCYSDFTGKCKTSNMLLQVPEGRMEYCDINDGMRLIVEYKTSFVTTIGCLLPAGAMFEKSKERGSALFLEHILFQVKHSLARKKLIIVYSMMQK